MVTQDEAQAETRRQVRSVTLDPEQVVALEEAAEERMTSVSAIVRLAVREYLDAVAERRERDGRV